MAEICRFLGIVITMYNREHNPPHFYARYGEHAAEIDLRGTILTGHLPPRTAGLVLEWLLSHRDELQEDWAFAQSMKPLKKIAPLE